MNNSVASIQYVHTNIIARDWKALAEFYVRVFGCEQVGPERDLSGSWVDRLTGIRDCRIRGIHLALPGYIEVPTLEIFSYEPESRLSGSKTLNGFGLAHIAFHVDSVEEVLNRLLEYGGAMHGELVKTRYEGIGELTVVYAQDPEGNFIELQNWNKSLL